MEGAVVYMLTFQVQSLTDEQEDAVFEALDAQPIHADGVNLVAMGIEGASLEAACSEAVDTMNELGLGVIRLYEDLVSRPQIADRVGVSTQAVGSWTRGHRHSHTPFPEAFSANAGGVWVWGEVVRWLQTVGKDGDGFDHPVREDYWRINAALTAGRFAPAAFAQPDIIASIQTGLDATVYVNYTTLALHAKHSGIKFIAGGSRGHDRDWFSAPWPEPLQYGILKGLTPQ